MITLNELKEMPEARKLLRLFSVSLLIWLFAIVLLLQVRHMTGTLSSNLSSGNLILNAASTHKSFPASQTNASAVSEGDALSVVSDVLEALQLRDRALQLQSNASGVLLQLERIYGDEMHEFLVTMESRGLRIKTAEIKVLPEGDDRLLSATYLLERNR